MTYKSPSSWNSHSVLSKQGTTDAYKQYGFDPNGDNEAMAMIRRFLPGVFEGAAANAAFGQSLGGQRRDAIQRLVNLLNPANQQAQLQGLHRRNVEGAAQSARQANLMNRSMGMGDGFQAGTTNSMFGQAQRQNNDLAREYASPEMGMRNLQSLLAAIGMGQQNPEMEQLYGLNSMLAQRDQTRKATQGSGSFIKQVAPFVGMAMGNPSWFGSRKAGGGGADADEDEDFEWFDADGYVRLGKEGFYTGGRAF